MKKFVHIGYPKNFSTSLQRNYFPVHDEIFHLGIGPGIGYADSLTESAFEVYLKSAKDFKYAEVKSRLQQHFSDLFSAAGASGKKVLTASSEHLSFAFANDSLGFEPKIARLAELFGADTGIIMIIRNQGDLIRSLYRESVRVGFPGSFSKYAYLLYKYQDRNFCYDFRYDLAYDVLCRYFSKNAIHVLQFEEMRAEGKLTLDKQGRTLLLAKLSDILGVHYMDIDFGHFNEALSDSVVEIKAELNVTNRHDLGNMLYETAEKHRMKSYLQDELGIHEAEEKLFEDVIMKRRLIAEAEQQAQSKQLRSDYSVDRQTGEWLSKFYTEGNARFAQVSGIALADDYRNIQF